MRYIYDGNTNSFYPIEMKPEYQQAGVWPEDGVDVSEGVFLKYTAIPPKGKQRGCDYNGFPVWVDLPPLTKEQHIGEAKKKVAELLGVANEKITPLQDAVDLNIATEHELESLREWKKFRVLVNRINFDDAPEIVWPVMPD